METENRTYTNYQIEVSQKLKKVADNFEMVKAFLELNNGQPAIFTHGVDVETGNIPIRVNSELTISNQFNFGQYLARRSLIKDLMAEGMDEEADDIVEASKQKYIVRQYKESRIFYDQEYDGLGIA